LSKGLIASTVGPKCKELGQLTIFTIGGEHAIGWEKKGVDDEWRGFNT